MDRCSLLHPCGERPACLTTPTRLLEKQAVHQLVSEQRKHTAAIPILQTPVSCATGSFLCGNLTTMYRDRVPTVPCDCRQRHLQPSALIKRVTGGSMITSGAPYQAAYDTFMPTHFIPILQTGPPAGQPAELTP